MEWKAIVTDGCRGAKNSRISVQIYEDGRWPRQSFPVSLCMSGSTLMLAV